MFLKQMLVCGTHYIQFVLPNTMRRKCVSSNVLNFMLCFQENKVNFIDFNFCSSYEGPPKYQSYNTRNKFKSEEKNKLKKWIDMVKFEGGIVPQHISEEHLSELLKLDNENSKLQYLEYLSKRDSAKMNARTRREKMKELKKEKRINRPKGHIEYGLWKYSIFAHISKYNLKNLRNHKLLNAMLFNQPLVIDLGFYDYMAGKEVFSLAKQIKVSFGMNRFNSEPFNLTLCNVDFNCRKFQQIYREIPTLSKPSFPINITTKSYLDIFPKEKLIYLTPDARDVMEEFDHEAIYIIGGLVDLQNNDPITHAKAMRENIKMMRLPVDRYHIPRERFHLSVHVMVAILLELQKHGDFKKAFKSIPRRLLFTGNENHHNVLNIKYSKF